MKTIALGNNGPQTTRLIYGCMRIAGTWDPAEYDQAKAKAAYAALDAAVEAGYTHFDHADIYGRTLCETIFGEYLNDHPGLRDKLTITTKCAIRSGEPKTFDWSSEHIIESAHASLKRLNCDSIDVLLLHRPDYLVEPQEVAKAFDKLQANGIVKHFGLSNCNIQRVELMANALDQKLVCNQLELHPLRISPWEDGTLDHLNRLGITPTAWSPLAGGRLTKTADPKQPNSTQDAVHNALIQAGKEYDVDLTTIALAWLMRHPSGILPVIGSCNPERIAAAAKADAIQLSRKTWYEIYTAAYGKNLP